MLEITVCPNCGSDRIKCVRKSVSGRVRGKRYTVPNVQYYECPVCGEKVYDREAMRKIEAGSPAFKKVTQP